MCMYVYLVVLIKVNGIYSSFLVRVFFIISLFFLEDKEINKCCWMLVIIEKIENLYYF